MRAVIKFRARLARLAFGGRRGKDLHNLHSIFSFNVILLPTHATSNATGLTSVKRSICIIRSLFSDDNLTRGHRSRRQSSEEKVHYGLI